MKIYINLLKQRYNKSRNKFLKKISQVRVEGRRCNTLCDLSLPLRPLSHQQHPWEMRQSWHVLHFPESLMEPLTLDRAEEKGSQVDAEELTEALSRLSADFLPEPDEEEMEAGGGQSEPAAPPSSPRAENT